MKKIFLIITAFVALAMFASCQKEQVNENMTAGVTRFTASIEQTKTAIDGVKISWCEGDEIKVADASSKIAIYVAESAGASTTFNIKSGGTPLGAGPYTATYGDIDNQVYDDSGANVPLTAEETTSTDFHFHSPNAVLKIIATSSKDYTIKKVTVENNGETLSTLTCSSGVKLQELASTVFYIAVTPGPYSNLKIILTAEETDEIGDNYKATMERSEAVTLCKGDLLSVTTYITDGKWACVAAGTVITMGDGNQKAVEKLEVGDVVRTVDHKTGQVSSAPVCFVEETKNVANAFTLTFGNDTDVTEVTVVQEHGFYNREERKYVFINANNAKDYIGHHFYDADNDRWLELKSCKLLDKAVDAYSVVTSKHLNHLADGMLSMCDGEEEILANIFEYDDHLKFDEAKKAADIAKYGLTSLDKILEYKGFTEADYYDYNLQYLNVAVGKGLISWDYVQALSDYYVANQIY